MRKKLMLLGAPVLAIACLSSLTACGKKYDLVIYNWEDYIYLGTDENGKIVDKSLVDKFVDYYAETHDGETISVAYETFSTNEDMYKQIKMGAIKADLICPSDYMIQKMANEGRLEPFSYDEAKDEYADSLKNWDEYGSPFIRDRFANETLKDGSSFLKYAVPYFWGTMGFTYDPTFFSPEEVSSWECLWTKGEVTDKYKNGKNFQQFSLKDSMRDSYVTAIFHVYKDEIAALDENDPDFNSKLSAIFNRCDDATIDKVGKALKEAKETTVKVFEVDEGKEAIIAGEYHANLAWSGDSVFSMDSAEESGKQLNYSLPEEGSNVWFDGWCMPKGANKELAEEFVNFICRPDNAALCMEEVGYTSPIVGEEIWEYVNDTYAADDDDADVYEVDLSFYFGDSIEGEAKINISNENKGRQFDAQYPTEEVLKRCCLMKDFGDQQTAVEKMWIEVSN